MSPPHCFCDSVSRPLPLALLCCLAPFRVQSLFQRGLLTIHSSFFIEGSGGYTAVGGKKMYMEPGALATLSDFRSPTFKADCPPLALPFS